MTNATDYNIQFVNIWQKASSRQEAYQLIKERLDPDVTYKKVVAKADYMRNKRNVPLKELKRSSTDWDAVKSAALTEN